MRPTPIGRFLPVKATRCTGQVECKWVVKWNPITQLACSCFRSKHPPGLIQIIWKVPLKTPF